MQPLPSLFRHLLAKYQDEYAFEAVNHELSLEAFVVFAEAEMARNPITTYGHAAQGLQATLQDRTVVLLSPALSQVPLHQQAYLMAAGAPTQDVPQSLHVGIHELGVIRVTDPFAQAAPPRDFAMEKAIADRLKQLSPGTW